MKQLHAIFLFILIFSGLAQVITAQDIRLEIDARDKGADSIIRQLDPQKTFSDYSNLKKELDHLQDTLVKIGFIDYHLTDLKNKNDTLYIGRLNLGQQIKKLHIYIKDNLVMAYAKKLKLPLNGNLITIDPVETPNTLARFTQLEAEAGYPLTYFELKNLKRRGDQLYAELAYKRETRRKIDEIVVKGYDNYPKSFVKHYANLKIGRSYNQSKIIKQTDQLGQLPFLNSTREPEVLFTKDSTRVFLYLKKNTANRFEGFLGFGTNENTGKLRFDGNLDLALVNNLNFGESLQVNYKSDGNDQQNLQVAAELPFLFGSPLGANLSLNLFRQDSTFSTNQQRVQLSYLLGTRSRLRAGVLFEKSTNLLQDLSSAPIELSDYNKTLLGAGYALVPKITNRLLGTSNEASIYASFGQRKAKGIAENQLRMEFNAGYTFQLSDRQQIYLANTTKNLSADSYLTNELFRFGGNKSIRGFVENSITANLFTAFRSEYRYIPTNNLYVHTIFDASYYENDILKNSGYLYSFGLGAGILTSAGMLNFNIASGLQEDQDFKFSNSIVHLEFITFF